MSPDSATERLICSLNLSPILGVQVEIDHFKPKGWAWRIEDDHFVVQGPWKKPDWAQSVREMCRVLAYAEGSLLLRTDEKRREFYSWRDKKGTGFKVVFVGVE